MSAHTPGPVSCTTSGLGYARLEAQVTRERPMGRLFPALHPEEIKNPGERAVARVLVEQLPRRVDAGKVVVVGHGSARNSGS